jgi:hypothetical protein
MNESTPIHLGLFVGLLLLGASLALWGHVGAHGSTTGPANGSGDYADTVEALCPSSDPDCRLALSAHDRAEAPR